MSSSKVYIVVPAFNEGNAIREVLQSLLEQAYEVVVIDDGSTDDTPEQIKNLPIHYLKHRINLGQGAAIQTGIEYARYKGAQWLVTFDADGQHNAKDIKSLLDPLVNEEADIVFGSRFMKGAVTNISPGRKFVLGLGRILNFLFTGLWLSDAHNGIRAMNRKAFASIELRENHLAHASEILFEVKRKHLRWKEIPVSISYNDYSRKKGTQPSSAIKILLDLTLHKLFE